MPRNIESLKMESFKCPNCGQEAFYETVAVEIKKGDPNGYRNVCKFCGKPINGGGK